MEVNIYFSCRVYIAYQHLRYTTKWIFVEPICRGPSLYKDTALITSIGILDRNRLIFNLRIHIPGKTIFILRRGPGLLSLFSSQINSAEDQVPID